MKRLIVYKGHQYTNGRYQGYRPVDSNAEERKCKVMASLRSDCVNGGINFSCGKIVLVEESPEFEARSQEGEYANNAVYCSLFQPITLLNGLEIIPSHTVAM